MYACGGGCLSVCVCMYVREQSGKKKQDKNQRNEIQKQPDALSKYIS